MSEHHRDRDHSAEDAFLAYVERDEARAWAQLYYHRLRAGIWDWDRFGLEPDSEPSWLTLQQHYPRRGDPDEPPP